MTDMAQNGRFGNNFFQFYFLKLMEKKLGLRATCSPWQGDYFFDLDYSKEGQTPDLVIDLEPDTDRAAGYARQFETILSQPLGEHGVLDINGYFQYHSRFYADERAHFDSVFRFKQMMHDHIGASLRLLGLDRNFILAVHVRAGDYRKQSPFDPVFWIPSDQRYCEAVASVLESYPRDVTLYLASDELEYYRPMFEREGFGCVTRNELFSEMDQTMGLGVDFYMMAHADALLISNSSFSYAAAMCNRKARLFMRPGGRSGGFIPFDPWNSHVLIPRAIPNNQAGVRP